MPVQRSRSPGRFRRHRRVVVAMVLLLLAGGGLTLGFALTWRPAWYRPASVDLARLRADKAALFKLQENISAALNAGRAITFELHEDQVNRWLAARAELKLLAEVDALPLADPVVSFSPAGIRIASLVQRHGLALVLSARGQITPTGTQVVVTCDAVRLGALPVPRSWFWNALADFRRTADPTNPPARPGAIILPNEWLWPNGKRPFWLHEFECSDGRVRITLRPVPR